MRETLHIYEDLNESSSASPGGSQQLEIPPSLNSKRAASIFQSRWFFSRRGDFNARQDSIVRLFFQESTNIFQIHLFFWKAPIFFKSACFSGKRQYFQIRLFFWKALIFSKSACFFFKAQGFCRFAWFFLATNICAYFQYLFLHLSMCQYFGAIVLTLGLRLILQ